MAAPSVRFVVGEDLLDPAGDDDSLDGPACSLLPSGDAIGEGDEERWTIPGVIDDENPPLDGPATRCCCCPC